MGRVLREGLYGGDVEMMDHYRTQGALVRMERS